MKKCSKCGVDKPVDAFYSRASSKDGLRGECKACLIIAHGEYVGRNRGRVAAYKAAWRTENIVRLKAARKTKYQADPDRFKQASKEWAEKNRARVRVIKSSWKKRNPEYTRADAAKRRALDPEKARAATRKWIKNNLAYMRAKNMKRHAAKLKAVPTWSETGLIGVVYEKAKQWGMEVDHVVPLQHPLVCGLHVWANLQLLTKTENLKKKNRHWPDMP